MKLLKKIAFFMLALLVVNSCTSDDDGSGSSSGSSGSGASGFTGQGIQRSFLGKVKDLTNTAVSGAQVTIGSSTVMTDARGVFIIENVNVFSKQAYIKVEKNGFYKALKTTVPTSGVNKVAITLITKGANQVVSSGATSTVSLLGGAQVTFDGNFEDANGNPYSGNVNVSLYYLDAGDNDLEAKMPGNMQAEASNGNENVLETYGMLNVELTDDSGQALNVASGSMAQIEVPINASLVSGAPATIPLWHFDETKGYWVEEGMATKVGNKYVGDVSHFSWWNCDAFFPTTDFCLTVTDQTTGQPLANIEVQITFSGTSFPRSGFSNALGEICGLIPSNEVITLNAFDICGSSVYTTTLGPYSGSGNSGSIVLPTSAITSTAIVGDFYDCNNNPISNGYVEVVYGTSILYEHISNGQISLNAVVCNAINAFTLEGVDFDNLQSTGILNYTFTPPTTNVGSVLSCNTVDEFISFQKNNEPIVVYTSINNFASGTNGFSVIGANSGQSEELSFSMNTMVPGTYSYGTNIMSFYETSIQQFSIQTLDLTLASFGSNVGDYIDATYTGTVLDSSTNTTFNISGSIHVKRDF